MKAILKIQALTAWFTFVSGWCVYNAIQDIHKGNDDILLSLWIALALLTAGRAAIYANTRVNSRAKDQWAKDFFRDERPRP